MNDILIYPSARGFHVEFPYKPNPSAIRGFHGIGMAWQKNESGVKWHIPVDRLADALDFIGYWFGNKADAGREKYGVRVVEAEDLNSRKDAA